MSGVSYSPSCLKHQAGRRPLLRRAREAAPRGREATQSDHLHKPNNKGVGGVCGSGVQCPHTSCWDNIGVVVFSGSL